MYCAYKDSKLEDHGIYFGLAERLGCTGGDLRYMILWLWVQNIGTSSCTGSTSTSRIWLFLETPKYHVLHTIYHILSVTMSYTINHIIGPPDFWKLPYLRYRPPKKGSNRLIRDALPVAVRALLAIDAVHRALSYI